MAALLSRDALKSRLGEAGLLLIDLRLAADGGREAYLAGHVPGAIYSDYAGDGWRQKVGNARACSRMMRISRAFSAGSASGRKRKWC